MTATPQSAKCAALTLEVPPSVPRAVAVGPWDQREFALVRADIDATAEWTHVPDIDAAVEHLVEASPAHELVLLAQPYPGYYADDAALRLERAAPLVRTIVVAGSWCEGERRTGRPIPGALRIYWHELPVWWRRAVGRWAAGDSPLWSQPVDEPAVQPWGDATICRQSQSEQPPNGAVSVLIDAADIAFYEALATALLSEGYGCSRVVRRQKASAGDRFGFPSKQFIAGVWDGCSLDDAECSQLQRFAQRFSQLPAPVIALVDSPRPQDYARLQAAGATSLLGKPLAVDALADELNRLTSALGAAR